MAVVLSLRWAGVTPEQYNAVRDEVRWEEKTPDGAVLHVAWFAGGGLQVTDVWNSQGEFERFFAERSRPLSRRPASQGSPRPSSRRSTGASWHPASAVRPERWFPELSVERARTGSDAGGAIHRGPDRLGAALIVYDH